MEKLVKICGLKDTSNFSKLVQINADMIGLNFYPKSVRYVDDNFETSILNQLPNSIKKVGVFVNEGEMTIRDKALDFQLDYIQLHGDENVPFVQSLLNQGMKVIKAFRIHSNFDWDSLSNYCDCDYFIFDSHSGQYGGSGQKFNWDSLSKYTLQIPFLLSGGIGPNDLNSVLTFQHPMYSGIDINSRFESSPGVKDMDMITTFIHSFKRANHD